MTEIRISRDAVPFIDHDLVEWVTDGPMEYTEFGFEDETGRFYVRIDGFYGVDRVLERARDRGFAVEFDGDDRLTFVPLDGDE